MAQYRITTDQGVVTIEGPDDATEQELHDAVDSHFNPAPATAEPPAAAPRSDLDRAKNLINAVRSGQSDNPGQVGSDALNLMSAPFRGVRGLAIGAGRALAGEPLQPTLQRTSEAMQPEFKPETPSEKVADVSSKLLEVAAPLAQSSRAVKAGRAMTELGTLKSARQAVLGLKAKAGVKMSEAIAPVSKKEATDLVNTITKARESGILNKVSLQNLHEDEVKLRNLLEGERVGGFGRFFGKKPAGKLTDQGVALAAKNKEAVITAQNNLIKGLKEARQRVGDIHLRNKVRNIIAGSLAAEAARRVFGGKGGTATSVISEVAQ